MDSNLKKKLKLAEFLKVCVCLVLPLSILCVSFSIFVNIMPFSGIVGMGGLLLLAIAIWGLILFVEYFRPILKSVKYLKKYNMESAINEIDTTAFTLPRSKIFLGDSVFYSAKPSSIIPYSMVVWVYVQQTKYAGIIPIDERVLMNCRDGSLFPIRANRNELPILLNQIQKQSPDLMIGYGNRESREYAKIIKEYSKKKR